MNSNNKINDEKRLILSELINVTREISSKYNGGKQVVTEEHPEVERLLQLLEKTLCYGLKSSILENVQELFLLSSAPNGNLFWSFASQHLTKHELERFSSYKNLWTDRGKTKALIRNALNERCLERYILTWLSAENIGEFYEPFALLRDEKATAILPKLAADLSPVLFAISIDIPELNVTSSKTPATKPEPIIAVPNSSNVMKASAGKLRRNIDDFEETVKVHEVTNSVKVENFLLPSSTLESSSHSSNKTSFTTESSAGSSSNFNFKDDMQNLHLKDDDTISHSSSSSDESFTENKEIQTVEHIATVEPLINATTQIDNEVIIQKQRERIMELENQILELTSENSRLRNLLSTTKINNLANFQISIPRATLQKTKTKNYYIYEINLRSKNGDESWTIFKRYRDFHKLHKNLKKEYLQIKVLDFPPKKKIGNLDFDFVEERRQRLQVYIRHVLQNLPELATCDSRKILEAKCPFFKT
ncbi:CLUMA_CG017780, isoform A [Clunio marinus]|uniref:CLUMA_CG017780, isoform A n=1 Tax=Clunio marinus TaxID=568069 RepID=A0A1J1IX91_9DIPT|nr:CLUMA_CG017780, isoform A [Clunio marinus]